MALRLLRHVSRRRVGVRALLPCRSDEPLPAREPRRTIRRTGTRLSLRRSSLAVGACAARTTCSSPLGPCDHARCLLVDLAGPFAVFVLAILAFPPVAVRDQHRQHPGPAGARRGRSASAGRRTWAVPVVPDQGRARELDSYWFVVRPAEWRDLALAWATADRSGVVSRLAAGVGSTSGRATLPCIISGQASLRGAGTTCRSGASFRSRSLRRCGRRVARLAIDGRPDAITLALRVFLFISLSMLVAVLPLVRATAVLARRIAPSRCGARPQPVRRAPAVPCACDPGCRRPGSSRSGVIARPRRRRLPRLLAVEPCVRCRAGRLLLPRGRVRPRPDLDRGRPGAATTSSRPTAASTSRSRRSRRSCSCRWWRSSGP